MTAYQLFRGLTGVDGELLAAVELVDSRKEPAPKKLPARKIWLVAAVIALALLLAGPSLSLPNVLGIRGVLGTKKTVVYVALVIVMATLSGFLFGNLF